MTKNEVIKWLRMNQCLNSFYRNYYNRHGHVNFEPRRGLIDDAFCWSDTPEGHNYWEELDRRFDISF